MADYSSLSSLLNDRNLTPCIAIQSEHYSTVFDRLRDPCQVYPPTRSPAYLLGCLTLGRSTESVALSSDCKHKYRSHEAGTLLGGKQK